LALTKKAPNVLPQLVSTSRINSGLKNLANDNLRTKVQGELRTLRTSFQEDFGGEKHLSIGAHETNININWRGVINHHGEKIL